MVAMEAFGHLSFAYNNDAEPAFMTELADLANTLGMKHAVP